jgi:hypothetical protein
MVRDLTLILEAPCNPGLLHDQLGDLADGVSLTGSELVVHNVTNAVAVEELVRAHGAHREYPVEQYDCRTCGQCCLAGVIPKHLPVVHRRCVHLSGSMDTRLTCEIYETRPEPCEGYTPGRFHCQMLRARVGLSLDGRA